MSQPKLIKGRKYVITGAADGENLRATVKAYGVKFPQVVSYDGECFDVKDNDGISHWSVTFFTYKRNYKVAKVEIHKNRKGHYYTVKGANGKVLNHSYNSKRGCLNGIEALRRAMADFEIVDLTKPGK